MVHARLGVGGVGTDIGEAGVIRRPGADRVELFVEVRAGPGDLALRYAGVRAEGFDQVVGRSGKDAVDVCLRDDRVEGLVGPAPTPEQAREETAGPQFRDRDSPGRWPALSRSSPGARCARWCGCRSSRPTPHRSGRWPRPRSVPAAAAQRPRGRVQDHLPNAVTQAGEVGHAGTRPPGTPLDRTGSSPKTVARWPAPSSGSVHRQSMHARAAHSPAKIRHTTPRDTILVTRALASLLCPSPG